MSMTDNTFLYSCRKILQEGTSNEGEEIRALWKDTNEPAYTKKYFGLVSHYDLRCEFPLLTLRPTPFKKAVDEILWIYQKKSNNVNDLNSHIWDAWADENGSIGKAYGYQIGQKSIYKEGEFDQIDRVLYDLKHNPFSRRIMMNMYNMQDLHDMALYPCAYNCIFNVIKPEKSEKLILNMQLNQRSQDFLVANNWNVSQYAALLMMIAKSVDMIPGQFMHVITDAHIYLRHIPLVEELCERDQYRAPIVKLDTDKTDFYSFTPDDFTIINYQHGEQIKNIPVAV